MLYATSISFLFRFGPTFPIAFPFRYGVALSLIHIALTNLVATTLIAGKNLNPLAYYLTFSCRSVMIDVASHYHGSWHNSCMLIFCLL